MSENNVMSTASTGSTGSTGGRRRSRSAVSSVVTRELQQTGLGHQIGDRGGVELGGVDRRGLEVLEGHEHRVGGHVRADGVLEGRALLEHLLAGLARDELQQR